MYSITGPLKLTVELKGKPKDFQGTRAGLYILGPNEVNGKSHWLQDSGTNAIWHDKPNGDWNIGTQDDIGNSSASVFIYTTEDVAGPQKAKVWKYGKSGKWIISDDILVETPGMYINMMRIIWVFLKTDMYFHLPELVFYYRPTQIHC